MFCGWCGGTGSVPASDASPCRAAAHARAHALPPVGFAVALPVPRRVFGLALTCVLQGWGRRPGAGLPGRAGRAPGNEEPPAPHCPCGATGCKGQLPDRLDLHHGCVGHPLPSPAAIPPGDPSLLGKEETAQNG